MLPILFRNSLGFHTFLLLLLLSLNCPILGKMCLADLGSLFPVVFPGNPYLFELHFLPDELSFLPVYVWIELLKPGVSKDDAILP
jgi:hypothetical protein